MKSSTSLRDAVRARLGLGVGVARGIGLVALAASALSVGCVEKTECSALDETGKPRTEKELSQCAKQKDCPRSCLCRDLGRCETGPGGKCIIGSAKHCERSRLCKLRGACSFDGENCVVKTDAECRASETCERAGKCKAVDGVCTYGVMP